MSLQDCPICGKSRDGGVKFDGSPGQAEHLIICPQCGQFECDTSTRTNLPDRLTDAVKGGLSCATRQAWEAVKKPLYVTLSKAQELATPHMNTRVSDNLDKLLRLIATRSGRPGGPLATFDYVTDFTLIDCCRDGEFGQYLDWLQEAGTAQRMPGSNSRAAQFRLTMKGWNQVQPLPRQGGIPGRCFVAMAFDPTLNDVFDLGITPAVIDCGFPLPLRIDRKDHNNQITDELIAAIRDAEFMVADLTLQRQSVYFEAGFARGLGREVIYCCRDIDFDNRHFDVEQVKAIKWASVTDLREQLARRIKATIIPKG